MDLARILIVVMLTAKKHEYWQNRYVDIVTSQLDMIASFAECPNWFMQPVMRTRLQPSAKKNCL